MARSAWTPLALASFGLSALLSGCVVTSSSDTDGGIDMGGSAGSDAGTTGGSATGGTGGAATGGSATGGGGGAAAALACQGGTPTAADSCGTPAAGGAPGTMDCATCLATYCCAEVKACNATNPNHECGFGGPTGQGEFQCIMDCTKNPTGDCAGQLAGDQAAFECCGGGSMCLTPSCPAGTISSESSDAAGCAFQNCVTECMTP